MLTLRVYSLPGGVSALVYIPEHVACLQVATYMYVRIYVCIIHVHDGDYFHRDLYWTDVM